ncbi:hypothetical protein Taro_018358 [Colocasia esculenta]|uniref:Uncharacterized protein n=1 Tax=Colocasia esculenta TaxID=4460 RepID=A0A843UTL0_COLES|nr:hypothetical protein [Colocasia esculenta]
MAAAKLRQLLLPHPRGSLPLGGLRRLRSVGAADLRPARGRSTKGSGCAGGPAAATATAEKKSLLRLKRRTRSASEFDREAYTQNLEWQVGGGRSVGEDGVAHVPVMLGEVLQVFSQRRLRSFVDCTVGAAGHSSAIIRAHPELQLYVGVDVDPEALEVARGRIDAAVESTSEAEERRPRIHMRHGNFRTVKSILGGGITGVGSGDAVDGTIDGILMDLGMSSMQVNNPKRGFSVIGDGPLDMRMDPQASLNAEDILNSWPEDEVGQILREYGEESNWRLLQKKIANARAHGGLHSTVELVNLVRTTSSKTRGRQGWMKTAIRVFQALRIAVNDELKTLEDALYACFDCLSSGGRLAVISFHSLEDRIVKQTFLDIINRDEGNDDAIEFRGHINDDQGKEIEMWSKRRIEGRNGIILTKRPITPTEEEEKLNYRCRSAKLRVIQKI